MEKVESVQTWGVGGWRGVGHGHGQVFSKLGPLLQRVEVTPCSRFYPTHIFRQPTSFPSPRTHLQHLIARIQLFQLLLIIHNTFDLIKPKVWLRSPLSKDPLKGIKCHAKSLPHCLVYCPCLNLMSREVCHHGLSVGYGAGSNDGADSKKSFFLVFALADPSPGRCLGISCFCFKWRSCQARRYRGTVGGGRVEFAELAF